MTYTRPLYLTTPTMKGNDVKEIQTRLSQIGFYTGSIDSSFGTATKQAVIKFQANTGLSQDGSCGPTTWDRLFYLNLKTPQKHGSDIMKMQQRLTSLKYNPGTIDGYFGENSKTAVITFQRRNGLTQDGSCGPATWNKLFSSSAVANASSGYTRPLYLTNPQIYGDDVRTMQQRLNSLGYNPGSIDGYFGENSKSAVITFQGRNGLTQDGSCGPATWNKLFSSSAIANSSKPTPPPSNNVSGQASNVSSANLIYFIKQSEGFAPSLYRDVVGVVTGGYGLTGSELNGLPSTISESTATKLLTNHVNNSYYKPVLNILYSKGVKNPLQREVDAFASFAYNLGVGSFKTSKLLELYIAGYRGEEIHAQFKRWVYAGGKVYPGLVKRREYEWGIFSGSSTNIPGYNCRPTISYINTSGNPTGKTVTENNGYGAKPY